MNMPVDELSQSPIDGPAARRGTVATEENQEPQAAPLGGLLGLIMSLFTGLFSRQSQPAEGIMGPPAPDTPVQATAPAPVVSPAVTPVAPAAAVAPTVTPVAPEAQPAQPEAASSIDREAYQRYAEEMKAGIGESLAQRRDEVKARIEVGSYSPADIDAHKASLERHGVTRYAETGARSQTLQEEYNQRYQAIQNRDVDKKIKYTMSKSLVEEYEPKWAAIRNENAATAGETVPVTDLERFNDEARRAKYTQAMLDGYKDGKDLPFAEANVDNAGRITVEIPEGAYGANVRISRARDGFMLEVDSKDPRNLEFNSRTVKHLTARDIDNLTIVHPGKGRVDLNVDDLKKANIRVVDRDGALIDGANQSMVVATGAAVNDYARPGPKVFTEEEKAARVAQQEAQREANKMKFRQQTLDDARYHADLRKLNNEGRNVAKRSGGKTRREVIPVGLGNVRDKDGRKVYNMRADAGDTGKHSETQVAFVDQMPEGGFKPLDTPGMPGGPGSTRNV
jgi:hypothetical protein